MKHPAILFALALLTLGSCSPAEPSGDVEPVAVAPEAPIVIEDVAFNIGIFLDQAENVLKQDDKAYLNVYRLSTPIPSALNQPDMEADLSQWRFQMSDDIPGRLIKLTLSSSASSEAAETLLDQVPGFSYLRTTEGKGMHHTIARFGRQCAHLSAECGVSSDEFAQVWKVVLQALDQPQLGGQHDQPCSAPIQ